MKVDLLTRVEQGGTETLNNVTSSKSSPVFRLTSNCCKKTADEDSDGADGRHKLDASPVEDDPTNQRPDTGMSDV